jgi:hypothetical protein
MIIRMADIIIPNKIILENGKPTGVISNYKQYLNILEMLNDAYDVREIEKNQAQETLF